jgi:excisionase family DNA binding protein
MDALRAQTEQWIDCFSLGNANDQFLTDFGLECAQEAQAIGANHITVDLQFVVFLKKFARFGYFHFGPISVDVRLIEDIALASLTGSNANTATMDDDMVRFSRVLMAEAARGGERRIDELHFLLAFMRWGEGLAGRVFGELGITPDQVLDHARQGGAPGPAVPEKLYSPEDAAAYLGVHVQTVRAWIRSGRLKASRLAGQRSLRIRAGDLQSVLEPVDPSEV